MSLKRYNQRVNVLARVCLIADSVVENYDENHTKGIAPYPKEIYEKEQKSLHDEFSKLLNMNFIQKLFY